MSTMAKKSFAPESATPIRLATPLACPAPAAVDEIGFGVRFKTG
jgi:hypothetical protein